MPSIDFEVWCSCGEGLCNQTENVNGGIKVEPCQTCLDNKYEEGHEEGYEKGREEGYTKGYEEGKELCKE